MKNIKFLLFVMLGLITMPAFSQTTLSEGSIKMEITEIDSDNEQMAAQLEMLRGTATEYFFNEVNLFDYFNYYFKTMFKYSIILLNFIRLSFPFISLSLDFY